MLHGTLSVPTSLSTIKSASVLVSKIASHDLTLTRLPAPRFKSQYYNSLGIASPVRENQIKNFQPMYRIYKLQTSLQIVSIDSCSTYQCRIYRLQFAIQRDVGLALKYSHLPRIKCGSRCIDRSIVIVFDVSPACLTIDALIKDELAKIKNFAEKELR